MFKSKITFLFLAVIFVSSLIFSCKTRKTPIVSTNNPKAEDSTKVINDDKVTKNISFCFKKDEFDSLKLNSKEYKYSVSSNSNSCSDASDDEVHKLQTSGNLIELESIKLEAPCSYELTISLLEKDGDKGLKEVKKVTAEVTIKESAATSDCYPLPIEQKPTPKPEPSTGTSIILQPVIVD